jgi:serine/threonine-protein kinase
VWNVLLADRYQLEELLGQGGMGEVWSARDDVLDRPVAVKVLLSHRADETAVERFRREAHAAGLLSHPNVVAVYDFGTHEDSLFLVMELVDGHTLTEELATHGTLSAEQAAGIAAQAAAGLAAAHNQDLVHRDIKPGNLLLTDDGTVKIADFGIARFISDATNDLTSTGQIVGTPYYLAPERATGAPAGPESDVYSLGCVLYQLVTGHPPFEGDTQAAVLYQHVDLPPVPPAELRPELAGPFQDGLLQMLAKDPADRPTAAQLAKWSLDTPPSWSSPAAKVLPTPPAAVAVSSQAVQKSRNRMIQTAVLAAGPQRSARRSSSAWRSTPDRRRTRRPRSHRWASRRRSPAAVDRPGTRPRPRPAALTPDRPPPVRPGW